ncbi:ribosome-releasing factor 2, mitochondrial [Anabrus simplex]|uniref:ribosome-releasing factor 2, mitochondrial n=1 Tax=Anabrus simplex TaxID=316456 RepID=UPI0035A2EDF3
MVKAILRYFLKKCLYPKMFTRRHVTVAGVKDDSDITKIRNVGILAHIDAGKTTTTERMLFYAGSILSLGEVHWGNTVCDFMEQEKERGISISAASVSFSWKSHTVNLIDTPGHIDFTSEVERALNVMDGTIILLDGTSGVEAQTLTVWRQADQYNLPRIIYVNKMDRPDADPEFCVQSIKSKLETEPLVIQLPVIQNKRLYGLVDLITMEFLHWNEETRGKQFSVSSLEKASNPLLWDKSVLARLELIQQLADVDDVLAKLIISQENFDIDADLLQQSLRRATSNKKGIPLLWGSSYKNMGVQPLMDAIVKYLPAPDLRMKQLVHCFGDSLCARAYKIYHDHQRKPITYFRVYTGNLCSGQKLYNIQKEKHDQIKKLFIPFADEPTEVNESGKGSIVAATGLKFTASGDFVTNSASVAASAIKRLSCFKCAPGEDIFRTSAKVPVPVFFCSIEPPSQAYQTKMEDALQELQREDPSVSVSTNVQTGQTILAGMGELHLEIIKNRIVSEYKIDVELGPVQIAYCETMLSQAKESHTVEQRIGKSQHRATILLSVFSSEIEEELPILDRSPEYLSDIAAIHPKHLSAIKLGIESALTYGPRGSCKVINVGVTLHRLEVSKGTSETIISTAANQCVRKILQSEGTRLMEPVMVIEVVSRTEDSAAVLADLNRRRSTLKSIIDRGHNKVISAVVPMQELLGYSSDLRTITSGTASFTMEFHDYRLMSLSDEEKALDNIRGL